VTLRIDVEKEKEDHAAIIIIDSPSTRRKFVTSTIGTSESQGQKETKLDSQNF